MKFITKIFGYYFNMLIKYTIFYVLYFLYFVFLYIYYSILITYHKIKFIIIYLT